MNQSTFHAKVLAYQGEVLGTAAFGKLHKVWVTGLRSWWSLPHKGLTGGWGAAKRHTGVAGSCG